MHQPITEREELALSAPCARSSPRHLEEILRDIALNSAQTPTERLMMFRDLVPRFLRGPSGSGTSDPALSLSALALSAELLLQTPASSPAYAAYFTDAVPAILAALKSSAALLTPQGLEQAIEAARSIKSLRGRISGMLLEHCASQLDALPAPLLATALAFVHPSDSTRAAMRTIAEHVLQRPELIPEDSLVRLAQHILRRSSISPHSLVALFRGAFAHHLSAGTLTSANSFSTLLNKLLKSAGPSHNVGLEASYGELSSEQHAWEQELSSRADEIVPKVALICEALSKGGPARRAVALQAVRATLDDSRELPTAQRLQRAVITIEGIAHTYTRDTGICADVVALTEDRLASLSNRDLSVLAASLGHLGYRDLSFFSELKREALMRAHSLQLPELLRLNKALVDVQVPHYAIATLLASAMRNSGHSLGQLEYCKALPLLAIEEPRLLDGLCSPCDLLRITKRAAWTKTLHALILGGYRLTAEVAAQHRAFLSSADDAEPSPVERSFVSALQRRLRHFPEVSLLPNVVIAGIQVDLVLEVRSKRFLIELDGDLHHALLGPDANGLHFGKDHIQDRIFAGLFYPVRHIRKAGFTGTRLPETLDQLEHLVESELRTQRGPPRIYAC